MFKKILLSFLSLTLIFYSIFTPVAYAQSPWYSQGPFEWYLKVYDTSISPATDIFGERYTAAQVQWVFYSIVSFVLNMATGNHPSAIVCALSGNGTSCLVNLWNAIVHGQTGYVTPGQQGPNKTFLATLYSNPISGVGYIRSAASKIGIVKPVYAQGFGYEALNIVQQVWIQFRNVVYGLFIIFVIVLAFMIMFRQKISPQTAVTVQSALPKVIITLILVTFSYAIAGFMIDLMYVVIGLLAWLFTNTAFFNGNSWGQMFTYLTAGPQNLGALGWVVLYSAAFTTALVVNFLGAFAGNSILAFLVSGVVGVIGLVLIVLAALYVAFKVIWMLIRTYINLILLIIFSPVYIGVGALNMGGVGFGSWIRDLISNLAVFPIVGLLFNLAILFLGMAIYNSLGIINDAFGINLNLPTPGPTWMPPLTLGNGLQNVFFILISFGIFAIVPRTVELIKSAISGKPFGYGTAIGEALTGPTAFVGFATRAAAATPEVIKARLKRLGRGGGINEPPPSPG